MTWIDSREAKDRTVVLYRPRSPFQTNRSCSWARLRPIIRQDTHPPGLVSPYHSLDILYTYETAFCNGDIAIQHACSVMLQGSISSHPPMAKIYGFMLYNVAKLENIFDLAQSEYTMADSIHKVGKLTADKAQAHGVGRSIVVNKWQHLTNTDEQFVLELERILRPPIQKLQACRHHHPSRLQNNIWPPLLSSDQPPCTSHRSTDHTIPDRRIPALCGCFSTSDSLRTTPKRAINLADPLKARRSPSATQSRASISSSHHRRQATTWSERSSQTTRTGGASISRDESVL